MTEIGFAPKEIIPPEVCQLEILAAGKADTYGPQIGLKLKVVGGAHDGHTFMDYANRDEDTGQVTQTKTGSRNKVEHGTVGPASPEQVKANPKPDDGDDEDDMFADLPF
jgi:hypothetical protein